MNFVTDFAHRSLCGSVVEHRSAESEGLRFYSSWGLRIFSLSHTHDKTKNIFVNSLLSLKHIFYYQYYHNYWNNIMKLISNDYNIILYHK